MAGLSLHPGGREGARKLNFPFSLLCAGFQVVWGWPKSLLRFLHTTKDSLFIFTSNLIDLDILSMLAVSPYWLLAGRGQGRC